MRHGSLGLILTSFGLLLSLGCQGDNPAAEDQRPLVVTSIFPVGSLTQEMVGEVARVKTILPPGASPATFELTPHQLRDFTGAMLFFMVGGGLDEWVTQIPASAEGNPPVVRLADGIPLLAGDEEEHESGNPHIWLDPILVRDRLLPKMEAALVEVLPQEASGIQERARRLSDSLTALDVEIRTALQPLQHRSFVATHPAWSYFALRYGLEEVGSIHAHPGQEPSGREMAHLLETARDRHVDCLFMEPQIGEIAARAMAEELSLPTCLLDPLGGPDVEERDSYLALLRFNTRQFVRGLQERAR